MSTTLVKNATVVTASDRYDADIYVDNGVVTLIGKGLNVPADTVIDASGKLALPGGIDVHTHLDMPFGGTNSADDFESGTIAAAHGGTTTVVDFAIQNFGEGLYPAFEGWMKKAEGKAAIDYGFHMIVRELSDQASHDMDKMTRHEGITSFKLFMAYPGVFMVDDATIFRALLKTRDNGGINSFALLAIPLFVLSGQLMARGGIAHRVIGGPMVLAPALVMIVLSGVFPQPFLARTSTSVDALLDQVERRAIDAPVAMQSDEVRFDRMPILGTDQLD